MREGKGSPQIVRGVHPNFDLPDEGADDRPFRLSLVIFHREDLNVRRAILSFQLKGQNVDRSREMVQRRPRIVIAQLGEVQMSGRRWRGWRAWVRGQQREERLAGPTVVLCGTISVAFRIHEICCNAYLFG